MDRTYASCWILAAVVAFSGCEDLNPLSVTGCRSDRDCIDDRVCRLGTCRLAMLDAGAVDASASDGAVTSVDAGIPPAPIIDCDHQPQVVDTFECTALGPVFCPLAADGDLASSFGLECLEALNAPGCSTTGRVRNADLVLRLPQPVTVRGLRFAADWFSKRPVIYEVWASNSTATAGAPETTRVAQARANPLPWLCTDGFECDYYTPTECCRNGRDQAIDIQSIRTDHPKWDAVSFEGLQAEYWTFRVVTTDDPHSLLLFDVQLLSDICVEPD